MSLIKDNPSSALQEKKESQGIISVQSMVTCADEEGIFEYPPIQEETSSGSSENLSSSQALLEQVVGRLERHHSCESMGSLSEEDSNSGDEGHEGSMSDDGAEQKKEEATCERSTSVVSDASEEGGRDSGIEAEKEADLPPMVVPDESLMEKIVAQVEFYFSDANVVKDKFLLKHIRRNKEGFVSLKLVSSFKKVKQLTKDWRVVAYSLGKVSASIEINDLKTKIRRTQPLPEIDDAPVTCAVLALELPLEKPSVESVSKLFGAAGDIAFVRVLRAGGSLPPDVKSLMTKYPVLGEKHCAWIEFETPEAAKAATELSAEGEGMRVVLIVPESQKKQEKLNQRKQQQQQQPSSRKSSTNAPVFNKKNSLGSRKSSYNNHYNPAHNHTQHPNHNQNHFYQYKTRKDSTSHEQDARRTAVRRKAISLPSAQNPFLSDPSRRSEPRKVRPKSKSCTDFPSGSPPPSWVQRHLLAAAAESAASAASPIIGSRPPSTRVSRVSVGSLPLSEGIIRFPKGPDGTKGFGRESRLRQISETS